MSLNVYDILALIGYPALVKKSSQINKENFMKDYSKMTDEELEDEALDLAGEAWEMVKRGYGKNLPKTFEEMVESMREYLRNKQKESLKKESRNLSRDLETKATDLMPLRCNYSDVILPDFRASRR